MGQMDDLVKVVENKGTFNQIGVEILPDGSLRIDTGSFDAVQHDKAQKFLKEASELLGGTQKMIARKARRTHVHRHVHQGVGHSH